MRSKRSDAAVLLRRLSPTILLARCTRCQFCGGGHFSASPLPLARRGLLLFSPRGGGGEPQQRIFLLPARSHWVDVANAADLSVIHLSGGDRRTPPGFFGVFFFFGGRY